MRTKNKTVKTKAVHAKTNGDKHGIDANERHNLVNNMTSPGHALKFEKLWLFVGRCGGLDTFCSFFANSPNQGTRQNLAAMDPFRLETIVSLAVHLLFGCHSEHLLYYSYEAQDPRPSMAFSDGYGKHNSVPMQQQKKQLINIENNVFFLLLLLASIVDLEHLCIMRGHFGYYAEWAFHFEVHNNNMSGDKLLCTPDLTAQYHTLSTSKFPLTALHS